MIKKLNNIYLVVFLLIGPLLLAQDGEKIKVLFAKTQKVYNDDKELSLSINYRLFVNYTSSSISEQYDGLCIKKSKEMYLKIQNMEMLQTQKLSVKLNHDQKMIQVLSGNVAETSQSPIEIAGYLKYFKYKSLIDNGKQWKCVLLTSLYTQLPYGKIEIYIDKNSFRIDKQVLYLLDKATYKDAKGKEKSASPRLEISLKQSKQPDLFISRVFDVNNYIAAKGNSFIPSKKYSNYTMIKN